MVLWLCQGEASGVREDFSFLAYQSIRDSLAAGEVAEGDLPRGPWGLGDYKNVLSNSVAWFWLSVSSADGFQLRKPKQIMSGQSSLGGRA